MIADLQLTTGCLCTLGSVPRGRLCPAHPHRWVNPTPDPALTACGLLHAAGRRHAPVKPPSPPRATEGLLEWRRRAWQAMRGLSEAGRPFTTADLLDRVGPAPEGSTPALLAGLLDTATHSHRKLRQLPTGAYIARGALERPATTTGIDHPATSHAAARAVLPRTGTQRRAVYDAIAVGAMTDVELQSHLRLSPNSERPRRVELVEAGLVEDSGQRRTHGGNEHVVWRVRA